MKNLLKVYLTLCLLIALVYNSSAQIDFGIKTGLNGNNFGQSVEDEDDKVFIKTSLGYHLGLVMEMGVNKNLNFVTGLQYISKGGAQDLSELEENGITAEGKSILRLSYIEVPLNLQYEKNHFHIFGGAYLGLGIGGKSINDYTLKVDGFDEFVVDENQTIKSTYGEIDPNDLEDDDGAINGIDAGLNLGIGYELGPVLISLGYSMGLIDLEPKFTDRERDEDKITNRVITLSGTYMFGGHDEEH